MLDGDLPPEVAGDVAAAGLDLLPGAGEVGPRCTCPDDADPCKHSAAVCYLVADALDADPFAVLLLRGRTRGEVLAGLRARRRGAEPRPGAEPSGGPRPPQRQAGRPATMTRAWTPGPRWLRRRRPGRSPSRRCRPAGPGTRRRCRSTRRPGARGYVMTCWRSPPTRRARAWELAVGLDPDAGLSLGADADLARRADQASAHRPSPRSPAAAASANASWPAGGWHGATAARAGSSCCTVNGNPRPKRAGAAELLKAARAALSEAAGTPARVARNRVTAGRVQLRLGRDFLWYPYTRSAGEWEPTGPPQPDPARVAETL